jgi:hypothetical protein
VHGSNPARGHSAQAWRPATRSRPKGGMGALAAWLPCTANAWDGMVARLPTGRWWLAGGKVLSESSWGSLGGHRARRGLVGLTEGGGATMGRSDGGQLW